ncbi:MAG: hypothetical protein WC879_06050 [Melioribacteraceae bacterium]
MTKRLRSIKGQEAIKVFIRFGGVEINDKEFSSADEYKKLHDYVKRIFRRPKKDIAPKRRAW